MVHPQPSARATQVAQRHRWGTIPSTGTPRALSKVSDSAVGDRKHAEIANALRQIVPASRPFRNSEPRGGQPSQTKVGAWRTRRLASSCCRRCSPGHRGPGRPEQCARSAGSSARRGSQPGHLRDHRGGEQLSVCGSLQRVLLVSSAGLRAGAAARAAPRPPSSRSTTRASSAACPEDSPASRGPAGVISWAWPWGALVGLGDLVARTPARAASVPRRVAPG
mgnify:CR=1 FL=1